MWEFAMATDMPEGKAYFVRYKDGCVQDWTSQRKEWKDNSNAIGAIIGLEDGFKRISEEEANKIINSYK